MYSKMDSIALYSLGGSYSYARLYAQNDIYLQDATELNAYNILYSVNSILTFLKKLYK